MGGGNVGEKCTIGQAKIKTAHQKVIKAMYGKTEKILAED